MNGEPSHNNWSINRSAVIYFEAYELHWTTSNEEEEKEENKF